MPKTKKILLGIMCMFFALALSIAVFPNNISAAYRNPDTDSEILSLKNQISSVEQKLVELERSMRNTSSTLDAEMKNKEYIDSKISLVTESINAANTLIETYNNSIAMTVENIEYLESQISQQYDYFSDWIKAFYETGSVNFLSMIFDNDNFYDMMTSTEYVSKIMKSNNEFLAGLEENCKDLNEEKAKLESYRQEQVELNDKLALQKQELDSLLKQSQDYIAQLQKNQAKQKSDYIKYKQADAALSKQLEDELALIALQNSVYVGGEFRWPVDPTYNRISSGYGYRTLFGYTSLHEGIDIPCNLNANVYAANAGKVIKAELHVSYGYYVMIDHGGGKSTLYAHNNKLNVSVGQTVKKGDVIAFAGTTGNSTGVHCHFEVRINGKTTDPLGYVTQP